MSDSMNVWAVIVAAGRGHRVGADTRAPKQYREVGGMTIIARAMRPFLDHPDISGVVVVIHADDEELFEAATRELSGLVPVRIVHGGKTRQESSRIGLESIADKGADFVLIHDAARPFIDRATVDRVIDALRDGAEAVLPAVAVSDTLKRIDDHQTVIDTVSRDGLFAAQTPQGFDFNTVLDAHRKAVVASEARFTDDCAVMEWAGHAVKLSRGSRTNTKITTLEDLHMAEDMLNARRLPDIRTGNGYDVHRLVEGDGVWLCGIKIDHDKRLDGHSDADVALHALTDALLATCGAGDIGDHFPPSDPQWKGASSSIFLRKAVDIVAEHGGTVLNADVSLIAEAPKIGPHRQAMRESLARIIGITVDRCSVKATTNEKLGFVGRDEGIAAIATASVYYGDLDGK
ncbi:MAG: bifunctional 2-C-methyl-D-erythritol 4-phosphate cytidylyltransferase/2-C-methyl-D-erythritol 2,4-cyclodiphosphate synthase [Rhizobiales bacterium]|nr:bifunctional 2-C-methyl-D-erythritol 4-phosphate cytidylyltransferase/2-C-methyl-D-erythritol 2,4-cyclodiphosphate synthase [Hyphomicrobiales bacterium]MBA69100.1 bifunctional 2-C-methyl-D-erythritol 4-phosphate cytidylyltransferase/2-C-methyl-D-erythritol 2,4-cyclodiphosphate synthase [Hyphomicrobiales bacterium]|tara:strand:- start:1426 stop:2634 length:1209 start_codon:yes stop_codon:yes gene_type:complete